MDCNRIPINSLVLYESIEPDIILICPFLPSYRHFAENSNFSYLRKSSKWLIQILLLLMTSVNITVLLLVVKKDLWYVGRSCNGQWNLGWPLLEQKSLFFSEFVPRWLPNYFQRNSCCKSVENRQMRLLAGSMDLCTIRLSNCCVILILR